MNEVWVNGPGVGPPQSGNFPITRLEGADNSGVDMSLGELRVAEHRFPSYAS
jgi:hypothetical protein